MAILVPTFALARTLGDRVEIEAASVGELLDKASGQYGDPFRAALATAAIIVNGRSINLRKGRATPLSPGDTVWMVRPSSGG
jgi:molybdopterin converting factor small subunit